MLYAPIYNNITVDVLSYDQIQVQVFLVIVKSPEKKPFSNHLLVSTNLRLKIRLLFSVQRELRHGSAGARGGVSSRGRRILP